MQRPALLAPVYAQTTHYMLAMFHIAVADPASSASTEVRTYFLTDNFHALICISVAGLFNYDNKQQFCCMSVSFILLLFDFLCESNAVMYSVQLADMDALCCVACENGRFDAKCGNYCHCRAGNPCLPISATCPMRRKCAKGWISSDPTGAIPDLYCNHRGKSQDLQ